MLDYRDEDTFFVGFAVQLHPLVPNVILRIYTGSRLSAPSLVTHSNLYRPRVLTMINASMGTFVWNNKKGKRLMNTMMTYVQIKKHRLIGGWIKWINTIWHQHVERIKDLMEHGGCDAHYPRFYGNWRTIVMKIIRVRFEKIRVKDMMKIVDAFSFVRLNPSNSWEIHCNLLYRRAKWPGMRTEIQYGKWRFKICIDIFRWFIDDWQLFNSRLLRVIVHCFYFLNL